MDNIVNFWCAHGKSHGHGKNIMGVPVTVAMGNAYYVFFCAHGNSHGHAHAYSHGHAHDYVHGHVYYWQTCYQVPPWGHYLSQPLGRLRLPAHRPEQEASLEAVGGVSEDQDCQGEWVCDAWQGPPGQEAFGEQGSVKPKNGKFLTMAADTWGRVN